MRYVVKGGVWKNTEDEILKAAVMKYGKNQWARISSLLVRKTPKQCKARWYEWLDPSIKKTEWTRDEEEKLLHLAKIMPTQWHTIAPLIGRTAAQCLEHYEKLLDVAQEKDEAREEKDDPRKLRPGEIDPRPEIRPARPDPVDMDEDEKEMLNEARARLANTKGKKAKRKAREKQLEEARRLAALQKKRELKAAGIEIKYHKRRRKDGIDYNNEIPFEKQAPKGFFDTSADLKRTHQVKKDPTFTNINISEIDGERRDEIEERQRKKDAARLKLHKKTNLPEVLNQINKLNDPTVVQRRTKLILPAPQVSDRELEDISKMGTSASDTSNGPAATQTLLSNYNATPTPARMASRTPLGADTVLLESQRLLSLQSAQTPLKGGESTPMHDADFSGLTPKSKALATPNALAQMTPSRSGMTPDAAAASKLPQSVHGTPVRDSMGINAADIAAEAANKRQQANLRKRLLTSLQDLPAPVNEYAVVLPEIPESAEPAEEFVEEDAEDIVSRGRAKVVAEQQAELRRRSQVIQRDLPRPLKVNSAISSETVLESDSKEAHKDLVAASDVVTKELVKLMKFDDVKYPVDPSKKSDLSKAPTIQQFSEEEISEARQIVSKELDVINQERDISSVEFASVWQACSSDIVYFPSQKKFGSFSQASKADQLQALQQEFSLISDVLSNEVKNAKKVENKASILCGGYMQVAAKLHVQISENYNSGVELAHELACFRELDSLESIGIPHRIQILKAEVDTEAEKEQSLQQRYARLAAEKQALLQAASGKQ